MTASAAAGSAAAGGAAAPVPLPARPPRPLSARPLAAVGCGLAGAGRRPAAADEGWGRCRFPLPRSPLFWAEEGGGRRRQRGAARRERAGPGRLCGRRVSQRGSESAGRHGPELVVSGLRRQTKGPCSAVHSACGRDTAPSPSPCFRRSPYVTSESKMAIAQWCCFAKSLRYSVAQRCSGVRPCFVLSGSNPASAALSVWQFFYVCP